MVWDRGYWMPEDKDVDRALREGQLKFSLYGAKLRGSWALVRTVIGGSPRTKWLLIKHRDGHEREGNDTVSDQDRSVASGRTMEEIGAGKGRRPKPFMLAGKAATSDAVWHSHRISRSRSAIRAAASFFAACGVAEARHHTSATPQAAARKP